MNKFFNQSNKIVIFLVIFLVLQACGTSPVRKTALTDNNQSNLEFLLSQIKQVNAEQRSSLIVKAADLLIAQQRYEKAQELLIRVNQQTLSPQQADDFRLYYAETLLALNAPDAALGQLSSISNLTTKPIEWQKRYHIGLSNTYLAIGNYFEAAKLRIELHDLIDKEAIEEENNEKIWFALNQIETSFLQQLLSDFNSQRMNGWLEVVYINKRWGAEPKQLLAQLELWKKKYPLHPSLINQPAPLQRAASAETYQPTQIAILLPLTGKTADIANMISDGILAAHYNITNMVNKTQPTILSKASKEAPILSFYDTSNTLTAITPFQQAISDGADFIIGPLTKKSIDEVLSQEQISVPVLALNRLEQNQSPHSHPQVFQFGLAPEDEAIQSAHRAFENGFKKSVAILPDNTLGLRIESAFKNYFEQLGGELVDVKKYANAKSLSDDIQQILGVDSSIDRKKDLEKLLGRNLEFTPRRRQDIDFIFVNSKPAMGRSIKPFIKYYYAHDVPVIATSSIYSGSHSPQTDIDLNGIEFPDIPLLLSEQPQFQQMRELLAEVQPEVNGANSRYFALGYDSYNIMSQLAILKAFPDYRWHGLTGEIGVDDLGIVHRYLTWAQFNRGIPQVTKERVGAQRLNNQPLVIHQTLTPATVN